jgi:hypothetical protein
VAHAVLLARWSWQRLPDEIIQQAAIVKQRADAVARQAQINSQVSHQLGMLGISPGFNGGGLGGVDPDRALFISVMAMIRQHRGDPPPASEDSIAIAELVLTGHRQPYDALIAAAPPFARQQIAAVIPAAKMIGLERLLLVSSYVQAAFSLPHDRIFDLLPPEDRIRLHIQYLYDFSRRADLDENGRVQTRADMLRFVADLVENGAITNFGMTKDQILQQQSYQDVVGRLLALGWLSEAL